MMFTAIDIGNSTIKLGLFDNDYLTEIIFFRDIDSLVKRVKLIGKFEAGVSSVVPDMTKIILSSIGMLSIGKPYVITHKDSFNLKFEYASFYNLGLDRICSAEGAFHLFTKSEEYKTYSRSKYILIADFGTATTLNIIKYPGIFSGGTISPGIKTMIKALKHNTALLPDINVMDYIGVIGNDTKSCIASGVINSTLGLINKTIDHLKVELKAEKIYVYITGGNAESILEFLDFDYSYEKGLVFYGIKRIFDKNKRSNSN